MTVPGPTSPPTTLLMSPDDIQWKQSPVFTRPGYTICFCINGIGMVKTSITINGIEMDTQENFVDLTKLDHVAIMDMADAFLAGTKDPLNTPGATQTTMDIFSYVKSQKSSAAFTTSTWAVIPPASDAPPAAP